MDSLYSHETAIAQINISSDSPGFVGVIKDLENVWKNGQARLESRLKCLCISQDGCVIYERQIYFQCSSGESCLFPVKIFVFRKN